MNFFKKRNQYIFSLNQIEKFFFLTNYISLNNLLFNNSIRKLNNQLHLSNFFFFNFFLKKYFSIKSKKNVFLYFNNFNLNYIDLNKYLNWVLINLKKNNVPGMNMLISDSNFIKIIILTLLSKDTTIFINWIKSFLEILYYKNHKKFFILLKYIFFFFFKYLKFFFKIKGLKFNVKGKISLGGNSKKKKQSFSLGSFSLTKKSTFINFNKTHVNTLSGVLGVFFFIFF